MYSSILLDKDFSVSSRFQQKVKNSDQPNIGFIQNQIKVLKYQPQRETQILKHQNIFA